jgi:hypothetical protein
VRNFVSVERAAPVLDLTPQQVWRAIRENKFPFPYVRIGKLIRIDARAIGITDENYLKNRDAQETEHSLAATV